MGEQHPFTQLVVNLNGIDPDDAFSSVPYEKGYAFLYYLEQLLGGPGKEAHASTVHIHLANIYSFTAIFFRNF